MRYVCFLKVDITILFVDTLLQHYNLLKFTTKPDRNAQRYRKLWTKIF